MLSVVIFWNGVVWNGVVIFWKGDNEELGEIKTHGLSDQGDSDDRQITVARIEQHFKVNVNVKEDVMLEAVFTR